MREHGSLSVTWLSPAPPWVAYRIVVDDVEVGRVGYRKSAFLPLVAGRHAVVLRCRNPGYRSEAVQIDIQGNGRVDLFGGRRAQPAVLQTPREMVTWATESSIWLGFARSAPPIVESHSTRRGRSLAVWIAMVIFWLFTGSVAIAHGRWTSAVLSAGFLALGLDLVRKDLMARRRSRPRVDALR